MADTPEEIQRDIAAINGISAVRSLLKIVCSNTGMGFAAVARVSEGTWTACAVHDDISFGLGPGGQLDVNTTLCIEARAARAPVVIDHASRDPVYKSHHTPQLYKIESYISVPIIRGDGTYFGNLCAIDPNPRVVSDAKTVSMFESFAELIATQLDHNDRQQVTEAALLTERATADLREQFIAVLGHDLRNPLASVSALGELFARRKGEPEIARAGERIRTTTRRMAKLIDDILDFARGRLGSGLGIQVESVEDLGVGFANVIDEERQGHPDRVIQEQLDVLGSVRCDRGRMQQLLSNLLGNALTHGTSDRPITVRAHTDAQWLTVAVQNWGEVIPFETIGRIFEPYWRPVESKARGGLGLGLHICSQIVEAHGGTLEANSSSDHGTCFIARIPRG